MKGQTNIKKVKHKHFQKNLSYSHEEFKEKSWQSWLDDIHIGVTYAPDWKVLYKQSVVEFEATNDRFHLVVVANWRGQLLDFAKFSYALDHVDSKMEVVALDSVFLEGRRVVAVVFAPVVAFLVLPTRVEARPAVAVVEVSAV